MSDASLPTHLRLEVVTPEGLLLREDVDDVIVPGSEGQFGVRPGHTPLLATLGTGQILYTRAGVTRALTCFSGFCEVLPDAVSILADIGERPEDLDAERAEEAARRAAERLKTIRDQAGYDEAHAEYQRAVTRLAATRRQRDA